MKNRKAPTETKRQAIKDVLSGRLTVAAVAAESYSPIIFMEETNEGMLYSVEQNGQSRIYTEEQFTQDVLPKMKWAVCMMARDEEKRPLIFLPSNGR